MQHVVPLVGRLDGDDEVVAVGHHHVRDLSERRDSARRHHVATGGFAARRTYLVQRLPRHVDAVDLEDLVVDPQQPRALCQPAAYQAGYEDPRDLRGQRHAVITKVKASSTPTDQRVTPPSPRPVGSRARSRRPGCRSPAACGCRACGAARAGGSRARCPRR